MLRHFRHLLVAGLLPEAARSQQQMPDQPAAWLFRVVRNLALNSNRSFARRRRHEQVKAIERGGWFEAQPDVPILAAEAVAALEQLEPVDREIVVARIWGQMSFEQIAELTKCSLSTAHRRYSAALATMNQKLLAHTPRDYRTNQ